MLSHYSRQGDSNGLPIVSNSQWVGFVDDEYTTAELQGKAVENRARGRLVLSAREASYEIEKVRSIQRWSIAYLHPLSCPASQYLANTVIDVSNDKPIVEEIALLRGIKVIARTEKATLASDLEEKHKCEVRDIPNRLLPRSTLDNLIYPPQGLLRYRDLNHILNMTSSLGS